MSLIAQIVAAGEHELAPMWIPVYWFAIIPAVAFVFLGFVTWSFRDVANRHSHRTADATDEAAPH